MSKDKKYRNRDTEDFLRYSGDGLTDEERHALEREMQKDAFADEAVEGLSTLSQDEAMRDISELRDRLKKRTGIRKSLPWLRVAASAALILAVGVLYFTVIQDKLLRTDRVAVETESQDLSEKKSAKGDMESMDEREKKADHSPERSEQPATPVEEQAERDIEAARESGTIQRTGPQETADAGTASGPETENELSEEMAVEDDFGMDPGAGDTMILALEEELADIAATEGVNASRARQASIAEPTALSGETTGDKQYGEIPAKAAASDAAIPDSIPAMPVGGMESFEEYISLNLRFPAGDSLSSGGVVRMLFSIGQDGRPRNIEITETPGYAFSLEAVRLLQEGPAWMPMYKNGVVVYEKARLSIEFSR
jgi:hypothetical protein